MKLHPDREPQLPPTPSSLPLRTVSAPKLRFLSLPFGLSALAVAFLPLRLSELLKSYGAAMGGVSHLAANGGRKVAAHGGGAECLAARKRLLAWAGGGTS